MKGHTRRFFYLLASIFVCVQGFNIDTNFPVIFKGVKDSSFGFTVALNTNNEGSMALVTAPKGDYDTSSPNRTTGVLYRCNISTRICQQSFLDTPLDTTGITGQRDRYKEFKKEMHLGSSLDIQPGKNGIVVTCGHLWKNQIYGNEYVLSGACYAVNSNLNITTVNKLIPLNVRSMFTKGNPPVNYYIYGMAGFSAAYTEDGKHLLLGAPGVYDGVGSVIDYKVDYNMARQVPYIFRPELIQDEVLNFDSYIGYSVSSGEFYQNGRTSYVAGAPRAEKDNGCVYIFEQFEAGTPVIIQDKLTGKKMGEYFGSVVLGININVDQYTDLIVGAPFHSIGNIGDEGRVYVYISDGRVLEEQNEKLEGLKKPGARFGSAINAIGDLNLDGYTDIAIGAPYEDDVGAVYIYHGTVSGIKSKFAQRIVPEQLKAHFSGFGFSIAKGKDIDSNSYPDLLIGAYNSDSAVLLRSHPVISVQANMESNIKQIKVNSSECEINGLKESCFDITYCLKYSGKFVPDIVDMKITLEGDVQKFMKPRIYFMEETSTEKKSTIETEVTLRDNNDNCYDRKVYVRRNVEDFITPIPFHLTYDVKKSSTLPDFCSTCPVLDEFMPNRIMHQVMFWTGCGDDNECLSDLTVLVSFGRLRNTAIIIGENKALVMEITTKNKGEPAHQSIVHVRMPHNIKIINKGECTVDDDEPMNVSLKCNVGNPLQSGHSYMFQLKLDTSNLPSNLTQLEFEIMVNTTSTEINPSDNYVAVTVPIIAKASINLVGSTESDVIYLKDKMAETIPIIHRYTVIKSMPSPVSSVDVILSIPIKLATDQQKFLEISDVLVESSKMSGVTGHCNISADVQHKDDPHFKDIHKIDISGNRYISSDHPDHSDFDTTVIDCTTAICHTFYCVVGPFIHHEIAIFQIIGFINLTILQKAVGKRDITVIISEGFATITDENLQLKSLKNTDFAMVTTTLERHDLHKTRKIALWIIIVSIVAGILLLVLLILMLIKFGFFRRKEREEMDKMTESGNLLKKGESDPSIHEEEMALYNNSDNNIRNT